MILDLIVLVIILAAVLLVFMATVVHVAWKYMPCNPHYKWRAYNRHKIDTIEERR